MQTKIMILNVMKYKKETEKITKLGSRVTFILVDPELNNATDNYKGYTEVVCFYKGHEPFEKLTNDLIGKPLDAKFREVKDFANPMKVTNILESITYKDNVITLL